MSNTSFCDSSSEIIEVKNKYSYASSEIHPFAPLVALNSKYYKIVPTTCDLTELLGADMLLAITSQP
jgi:hypothetical protein